MMSIHNSRSIKYSGKLVWSVLGLNLLLALSGCSSDDSTVKQPASVSEEVVVEKSVSQPEQTAAEATIDSTAPTEVDNSVTPEIAAAPIDSADTEALAVDAGANLYEVQCKVCHAQGLLNAPRYGDKAAWMPALAKDRAILYMHSAQGYNKMPAQAVNGVSEGQVKAAVDYMLAAFS